MKTEQNKIIVKNYQYSKCITNGPTFSIDWFILHRFFAKFLFLYFLLLVNYYFQKLCDVARQTIYTLKYCCRINFY